MIVNSAYMYMVSAAEKVIKLFDKGKSNYPFKTTQGTVTLDAEGLHMGSVAGCSFSGVDLTGRTKVEINWLNTNYPPAGNFYLYIDDARGQQLHWAGFNNYDQTAKIVEMAIPQNCQIENATIRFLSNSRLLFNSVEIS